MSTHELLQVATARRLSLTGRAKQVRQAHRLSCREIGQAIGTGPSTIWRWETGDRVPHGPRAAAWAQLISELEADLERTA